MKRLTKILFGIICILSFSGCNNSKSVDPEELKYCFPGSEIRLDSGKEVLVKEYNLVQDDNTPNGYSANIDVYGEEYRVLIQFRDDNTLNVMSSARKVEGINSDEFEKLKSQLEDVYGEFIPQENSLGEPMDVCRVDIPGSDMVYDIEIYDKIDKEGNFEIISLVIADASASVALDKVNKELGEAWNSIAEKAVEFQNGIEK